jgi:hypothetical protein
MFSRAATSLSRSVRIAQMLNLHRIDHSNQPLLPTLAPPKDWSELEERRRTWWLIFCNDRFVCGTTGWPALINERDVRSTTTFGFPFQPPHEQLTSSRFTLYFPPQRRHSKAASKNRRVRYRAYYCNQARSTPHWPRECLPRAYFIGHWSTRRRVPNKTIPRTSRMVHIGNGTGGSTMT